MTRPTVKELSTLANAKAWSAESEKFIFCLYLLQFESCDSPGVDEEIDALEDAFENVLSLASSLEIHAEVAKKLAKDAMAKLIHRASPWLSSRERLAYLAMEPGNVEFDAVSQRLGNIAKDFWLI